jgi:hypothetical protein
MALLVYGQTTLPFVTRLRSSGSIGLGGIVFRRCEKVAVKDMPEEHITMLKNSTHGVVS